MKKLLIVLCLLLLAGTRTSIASHLMGGEVTWDCIKTGPNTGRFVFKVKLYRDCNGIPGPGSVTLTTNAPGWGGGILCPQVSLTDISPVGPGCPTCANPLGLANAVQEYIYQSAPILITGVPPATGWFFYYNDCCRNGAITNLGAGAGDFTLRAFMYPYNATNTNPCFDSSPQFAEKPQLGTCTRNETSYNHNAIDLELDSLVYSWGNPLQNGFPGTNYPFAGGYSATSPLPGPAQNPLNVAPVMNFQTGVVTFTSFTPGAFVTVTKVTAYKCGIKVAEIFREIQIALLNNCIISQPPTTPTTVYNTPPDVQDLLGNPLNAIIDTVFAGDTVDITLVAFDFESLPASASTAPNYPSQSLSLSASGSQFGTNFTNSSAGCPFPPCATLDPPLIDTIPPIQTNFFPLTLQTRFRWITDCNHLPKNVGCVNLSSTYNFVLKVYDNFCPSPAVNFNTLTIVVVAPPPVGKARMKCADVQANGNVNLTFLPPIDTGEVDTNQFFKAFYIYRSLAGPGGPFALIDSMKNFSIANYDTVLTYNDLTANANAGPISYYITTRSGCDLLARPLSDTISTMYLQVSQVGTDASLSWTPLRTPLPSSSTRKYYIFREQPPAGSGNWVLIDSTTSTTYLDPVFVCNDSINYRIHVVDTSAANCVSRSNIDGALLQSQVPNITAPSLRSTEVLANGDVALCWIGSIDTAQYFSEYRIYHSINRNGPYAQIGAVSNYAANVFTDVGANANATVNYYYLTLVAGCDATNLDETDISTSDTLASILLSTNNATLGFADLNWNPLRRPLPVTSTGSYIVNRRIPPGAWAVIGTTSDTTYRDTIVLCDTLIQYRVDIGDASACFSKSSVDQDQFSSLGDIIDNPDLRCLAVQANGDVQVTWIAPPDPNNFFAGVEVYYAATAAGPYNLVGTVTNYATTSFNHIGAAANGAPRYYYLKSLSGCDGLQTDGSTSDTLATMYLTVNNANLGFADLTWNAMHTPMLGTAPGPYRVMRRSTGVGAYVQIGTTNNLTYRDTITTCNVPFEYRIELNDNAPCTSISSADNDIFTYVGNVIGNPTLRCVSVLANGNIQLTWENPSPTSFANFNEYEIWRNGGAGFTLIDSVSNSALNTFTDINANGNTQPYSYYLVTQSGCTGQVTNGTNGNTLSSIFLTTAGILGQANLSWTPLASPLPATTTGGQYNVFNTYNAAGTLQQIGDTVLLVYQHPINDCDTTLSHQVTVNDNFGCISRSNITTGNFTFVGNIVNNPDLRCVDVLPNGQIQLTWIVPGGSNDEFNEYEIFRNSGAGFVLYDSVSNFNQTTWTDAFANGNNQSYSYYLRSQSGCTGQLDNGSTSATLSSIYLTATPVLGSANLTWTALSTPLPATVTGGQYNVWSTYNATGTLTVFGDTALLLYFQNIVDCDTTLSHRVTTTDNSGCISRSNVTTEDYTWQGNIVNNPDLRCVSVLPNGQIQLTWITPTGSNDEFNEYEIFRNSGAGFVLYDSVSNFNQTTWTDAFANGNNQSYSYYLRSQSGCTGQLDNGSTSTTLNSIYLTSSNATLGQAGLNWNALPAQPTSAAAGYNVWSSYPNGNSLSIISTTLLTSATETISDCDTTLLHQITLPDNSGCSSNSNIDTNTFTYIGNIVSNPDLRCVSVLPNGQIELTWITPSGSSDNFNEFEIFRNSGAGFVLYDSVSNFNQTTWTDAFANGNNQSYSYYLRSQSGCTGQVDNGATSATLNSIFLSSSNTTLGQAGLNWNALPAQPTSAAAGYNVWSSYPNGNTLSVITTTLLTAATEVINDCDTTLLHQITLPDNSGCSSNSNIDTNTFTYIGNIVNNPDLRCVSVLPNGQIELTWITPSGSSDNFNEFEIFRNSGAGFVLYDSVSNFNQTTWTDAFANGNNQSYSYYLRSQSGCTGQVDNGNTSVTLNSIYVSTTGVLGQATINWNAHPLQPSSAAGGYDVWSSYPNGNNLSIIASTTNLSTTETISNCDTTLLHRVSVTDNSGCISFSNVDTNTFTYIGNVINHPELRCASVLPNGQVSLTWQVPAPASWDDFNQYNVWRNTGAGFVLIDSIETYTTSTYLDATANGNLASISYYLQTKSGCTGQTDPSAVGGAATGNTMSTIFVTVSGGNTTTATLNWNAVSNPLLPTSSGTYIVEKEYPGGSGNWSVVANVAATTWQEQLTLCIDSINYRVSIGDAIGCTSVSNVDGEVFVDHTIPAPPSPRCASVLPNGNVVLTWVAPVDTGQRFGNYTIYRSGSMNGPYTPVAVITSYTTVSHTDAGANAQAASLYYFMTTQTDCGREVSPGSDTLRTIKTDVFNNNGVAVITWNPLHNPELPTATQSYTVFKEYPTGVWNAIGSTSAPTYQWSDTINVCEAIINYRVETGDQLGCTSVSSVDGDLFRDITRPTVALLDTVSLDPLNPSQVSVSWLPSPSGDVVGYIIYQFNGASWDSIGSVIGINSSYFLHNNPAAEFASQRYSIAAYDSCRNISSIGTSHNTLFITAKLDVCRSAIDVRWNPYINMVNGIGQYNVFVSENGGPFTFLASVPGNNVTYSHTTLTNGSTYCYYVQAQGNTNTRTASSNQACELANLLTLPTFSYLKKATVIDSRRVIVECYVDIANNPDVSRYKLQRAFEKTGPFTTVGAVPYTGQQIITLIDFSARTDEYSYYYRVITVDSCGNEVLISNVGRTILLKGSPQFNLINKLNWNFYEEWLGNVSNYSLFRSVDGIWSPTPIVTVNNGILTYDDDVSALYPYPTYSGKFCYRVDAYEGPGNTYGFTDTSQSNIFCLIQEPHIFVPNAFTPTGKNPIFKPEFIYIDAKNYYFVVFNRWGQKVYESRMPGEGWDGTYQGNIAPEGTYVYTVRIFGTNGQEIEKSGSVTLLR